MKAVVKEVEAVAREGSHVLITNNPLRTVCNFSYDHGDFPRKAASLIDFQLFCLYLNN